MQRQRGAPSATPQGSKAGEVQVGGDSQLRSSADGAAPEHQVGSVPRLCGQLVRGESRKARSTDLPQGDGEGGPK